MQRMLELKSLSVQYGPVRALSSVSLKADRGQIVALLGSNGAGKSTLMRAIIGLVDLEAGEIIFDEERIDQMPVEHRVHRGIATILEGRGMLPRMTVFENLQMGAFLRVDTRLDDDLDQVFKMFPVLRERSRQAAGTLSGGEQQMLAFGRALMMQPKLILMDEPSMGLAPVIVERVFDAIEEINRIGTTVLLVEQNARMALSIADRFYVLRTGAILLEGSVDGDRLLVDRGDGNLVRVSEDELEAAYLE